MSLNAIFILLLLGVFILLFGMMAFFVIVMFKDQ